MKQCTRCNKTKEYEFFAKRATSSDGRSSWCKECFKNYDRERYINGDKERKDRNKQSRLEKVRKELWRFLLKSECLNCGNSDPEVLEFDHREQSEKSHNISEMLRDYSWPTILKEIEKCDVLCANCHRKRTIIQLGFWRGIQENEI